VSSEPEPTRVEPERKRCGRCRRRLHVQKTRTRTIVTTSGETPITEVTRSCSEHAEQVFPPDQDLVPPKSKYGYDIIAEAGRLRFLENKQVQEIKDDFSTRGIGVPGRTVQWLCDRFLLFIMAVHWESLSILSRLFRAQGGYVLHIDGSGRSGPMVLLLREGWSGIRLLTAPIRSEAAEFIIPYLKSVRDRFGNPVAVVTDMSKGNIAAIREVFPGVYIIICHYHFLQSVGTKLFEPFYPRFRGKVDHRGVKKKLRTLRRILRHRKALDEDEAMTLSIADYILAYEKDGKGLAYPFSLPMVDFYRRCAEAGMKVRKAILARARKNVYSPSLSRLENSLRLLKPPPIVLGRLQADFDDLCVRWAWFQRIRWALRYRNGPIPLSTHVMLSDKDLEKGRRKLDRILAKIEELEEKGGLDHHSRELRKSLRRVASSIMAQRENLFAPNLLVNVNGKKIVKKLPRTNAPEEGEFRKARRHCRRIRGNSDVERQFQRDGPGMLMVQNLTHREYVRMVYGSLGQMATRFAKVSPENLMHAKSYMGGSRELSMVGNH